MAAWTWWLIMWGCWLAQLHRAKGQAQMQNSNYRCDFHDLSPAISVILCAVEQGRWYIPRNSTTLRLAGCLLGGKNRCSTVRAVPTEAEIPASAAPPSAKNKQYQALAMKAEEIVPKTWWREGFGNDQLLLTKEESDFPRKQFDAGRLSNKKLKNLHQCVTRQQFIRRSFGADGDAEAGDKAAVAWCAAADVPVIGAFWDLWKASGGLLGGTLQPSAGPSSSKKDWEPSKADEGKTLVAALEVLEHFYSNYGGVWTGCFKLERSADCRGALAAAALVSSAHILHDLTARRKDKSESTFVGGYLLASLARGLLHGDALTTGNSPSTVWQIRLTDTVALQAAYLKIYVDSFGAMYAEQLAKHLPMAFAPSFAVQAKREWTHMAGFLEPVLTSLRNWMYSESGNLIDFGPYRPLAAFDEVRRKVVQEGRRRVLVDVGANGFFASPKYLIDSYAPYMPFTHAIMIEPEPHFSATVPQAYSDRYNITFLQIYAEVNTGSATDIIKLLPTLVRPDDFVVLKFDVDPNRYAQGPTMEWGFLFALMQSEETARLVDETYIELHFSFPKLYWAHYHSNWEALDCLRYLRAKGAVVHSWVRNTTPDTR